MRRLLLAAVALLAACGDDAPAARPAGPVDLVAFTRTAETITGDRIELAGYADRDLVVWFWAPW